MTGAVVIVIVVVGPSSSSPFLLIFLLPLFLLPFCLLLALFWEVKNVFVAVVNVVFVVRVVFHHLLLLPFFFSVFICWSFVLGGKNWASRLW